MKKQVKKYRLFCSNGIYKKELIFNGYICKCSKYINGKWENFYSTSIFPENDFLNNNLYN